MRIRTTDNGGPGNRYIAQIWDDDGYETSCTGRTPEEAKRKVLLYDALCRIRRTPGDKFSPYSFQQMTLREMEKAAKREGVVIDG